MGVNETFCCDGQRKKERKEDEPPCELVTAETTLVGPVSCVWKEVGGVSTVDNWMMERDLG